MDLAIELDGLERRYGERVALSAVSVSVPRGATLALLGGNGAGKTTLLRVLAGLLRPHGGTARVLGATLPAERWQLPVPAPAPTGGGGSLLPDVQVEAEVEVEPPPRPVPDSLVP